MGKHPAPLHQGFGHALAQYQTAHGQVTGGQALGDRQRVGFEAEMLMGKPLTCTTETANHFISAQQHIVLATDTLDLWPVAFWRKNHAAGALERFSDKTGDVLRAQLQNLFFQLQGAAPPELGRGQVTTLGVPIRLVNVRDVRDQAAHFMHEFHAAQGRRRQGGAVIAVPATDHDLLLRLAEHLPVAAYGADQHLIGFGTGVGVDHMAVVPWQQAEQQLGQLDHRRMGGVKEHVVVRQLIHLRSRRSGQVLAAITQLRTPQARHPVQVTLTLAVPQVQALTADHYAWAFGIQRLLIHKGMDMVRRVRGLVVLGLALRFKG